ncbi:MAG TPA: DHA2 family efflux MFS transporter permease subunit [Chitinophagaceae bacterium]|nr:DHA2 family efflux MFS transporter permease subunit [Chitinophagaceae bacterium]
MPEPEVGIRKWIITLTLVFATLMQLIDVTVVNVAMPHIMGNLGVSFDNIGWVVTAYTIGIIIVLPISGWLGKLIGRKRYFMLSVVGFTVASFFCGSATSLPMLIFFRFIQGLCGGGMSPTAQAILIESWPKKQLGFAMGMFGMGVVLGPVIGPVLGGYITDQFSWRWCFYINIPFSIIALFMITTFIRKTPKEKHKKVDWLGLAILTISVISLQVVLERGEKADWFNAAYIVVFSFVAVLGFISFVWRELQTDHPVVNLRVFRHRSFTLGSLTRFTFGLGFVAIVFIYPLLFQNLLGFSAEQTGLVTIPSALATIVMMPFVGKLVNKKIPTQLVTCTGILFFLAFCYLMQKTTLAYGMESFIPPLILRGIGMSLLFVPISTMSVQDLEGDEIGEGTGIGTMVRQIGGALGIALVTTFVDHRFEFHRTILGQNINNYNPAFLNQLKGMTAHFIASGETQHVAHQMAQKAIQGGLLQQSYLMSYTDVFWIVGIFFLILIPLLLAQKFKGD